MTAEQYLKSKGLKNPPLDSGIGGAVEWERQYASKVMEEYARIQIEKDRERVKAEFNENPFEPIEKVMAQTPIVLD